MSLTSLSRPVCAVVIAVSSLIMSGCVVSPSIYTEMADMNKNDKKSLAARAKSAAMDAQNGTNPMGNVEFHTSEFADELLENFRFRTNSRDQYRFVVATFVPPDHMEYDASKHHHLEKLGHQMEQGFMTELSRRGYISQDYKVMSNVMLQENAETIFSRDVENLKQHHHNVDFYLSGTITEIEDGAIVNARIIDVETKDVVAAATRYFPSDLFWYQGRVTTRSGMLYRTTY